MGFGAAIQSKKEKDTGSLLLDLEPHDLLKFGIIPELIGRLPMLVTLDSLDRDALIRILKEPKNALVKQYQRLLGMDHVGLTFDDEALERVADIALERKTGARGLRGVLESVMTQIMFDVPSNRSIKSVRITKDVVDKTGEPVLELVEPEEKPAELPQS